MSAPLLQLQQVSKRFNDGDERGNVVALRDISLTVQEGEFVSVLGPSGCGKSTLLRIIAGLIAPTTGQCLYKGQPVTKPSLERGYVFQDPRLFPWLTVLENINLAGVGANGEELLEKMDLSEFGQALPHELSGGMAQRVALARALAPKPHLLLLDEPLANLDVPLRQNLQIELQRIWEQQGVTCILVTHDIDEALALGTRLILLSKRPARIRYDLALDMSFPRKIHQEQVASLKTQILEWMEVH
ncbi:MAG: ABC transporter ATP-binding protein [Firmicutes bacterium]|nr:ABC transporter ATP-binding protein [Bacillota bacterium]